MTRLGSSFATIVAGLLWLAAASPVVAQQSIVAIVNDEPISAFDVDQRMRFIQVTTREEPSADMKKKALEMLVDERLQLQQAKKLGAPIDENSVTTVVGEMAKKNNLDEAGLGKALAQMGVNIKTLKDRIRANVAWQEVVRRKFRGDVVIADAEIEKMVEATATVTQGAAGEELQLQHVKLDAPANDEGALAARLADAERLRSQFTSCARLEDLVKSVRGASVRSMASTTPEKIAQPARAMVQSAKVGQMTPPNITASGIELYAVCGRKTATGAATVREDAERKLMQQEYGIRAKRLLRDLRQDAFIEYR